MKSSEETSVQRGVDFRSTTPFGWYIFSLFSSFPQNRFELDVTLLYLDELDLNFRGGGFQTNKLDNLDKTKHIVSFFAKYYNLSSILGGCFTQNLCLNHIYSIVL